MRRTISGLLIIAMSLCLVLSSPLVKADPQKTINSRTTVVRYSLFLKSNYTVQHDIDFIWSFRDTNWSKVSFQSSKPGLFGSANMDCRGQIVPTNSFDAIQALGWRFEKVAPSDLLHVDFKVKIDVSAFSPSSIAAPSVGKVSDLNTYLSTESLKRYLNETYYWDYSSAEIQSVISIIRQRVGGSTNVYDIVRGTLAWFAEHMMYDYPYEFDYPTSRVKASEVLKQSLLGRYFGVCRHFADLYTTIMRGFGIPCVKEEGLILQDIDGKMQVAGRHAWCIVYLPKLGWTRVEVTVPDRSSLDSVGVGLIPYPWYYVPEYVEYTNEAPKSSEGTVYPYVGLGGFIRVEEEEALLQLTWERVFLIALLGSVFVLVFVHTRMRSRIRRLEKSLQPTSRAQGPYPTPMFCTVCGAPRPAAGSFCTNCGSRLS